MVKKELFFIFAFILLANLSVLIVNGQLSQDYVQYQAAVNQQTQTNYGNIDPRQMVLDAIKNNPAVREEVVKSVLFISFVLLITVVDTILKGFAMWKASKKNSRIWFWVLLLVSTMGILPLCYLIFSKKADKHKK